MLKKVVVKCKKKDTVFDYRNSLELLLGNIYSLKNRCNIENKHHRLIPGQFYANLCSE